jgi:gamma-glutamylputrescine oxidase
MVQRMSPAMLCAPTGLPYWNASARHSPVPAAPLSGDITCDVAIIGAGFTGLSAADHLAGSGRTAVVLEAGDVAEGASGRTAGMVGTRYKLGWAALARTYGQDQARRLHALMGQAHARLHELLGRYGASDCFDQRGQLIPAHHRAPLEALQDDARWLAAEVGDDAPTLLDAGQFARVGGTSGYAGAWFDPRGGGLQPVDFCRALAHGLLDRGVRVFTRSRVMTLEETDDAVLLATRNGRVRARHVILATNAYTPAALVEPDPARRLVPVSASMVVTEPLSGNVARTILTDGQVASDTRRLLHAFRMLPGDRLLFAGRADITGQRAHASGSYVPLERALARTFPQAAGTPIAYRWSGLVGVSRDGFPHVGRIGRRVSYAMGYSGRGVVLAQLLGLFAARLALDQPVDAGVMDERSFLPWPARRLRIPVMQLMTWLYGHLDQRESARA